MYSAALIYGMRSAPPVACYFRGSLGTELWAANGMDEYKSATRGVPRTLSDFSCCRPSIAFVASAHVTPMVTYACVRRKDARRQHFDPLTDSNPRFLWYIENSSVFPPVFSCFVWHTHFTQNQRCSREELQINLRNIVKFANRNRQPGLDLRKAKKSCEHRHFGTYYSIGIFMGSRCHFSWPACRYKRVLISRKTIIQIMIIGIAPVSKFCQKGWHHIFSADRLFQRIERHRRQKRSRTLVAWSLDLKNLNRYTREYIYTIHNIIPGIQRAMRRLKIMAQRFPHR